MISIDEFRESYINEDINAEAINTSRYPIEVFIDNAVDILQNDYSLINGMEHCFYECTRGSKHMRIDAAYLDLTLGVLNLLYADYNQSQMKSITNTFITTKSRQLISFFENSLKGHFRNAELADPATQLAHNIVQQISSIGKIHLFIISTDKLSTAVKNLIVPNVEYNGRTIEVVLDVLDIEKIYRSRMVGFQRKDLVISCAEFGFEGIPCIKANIDTNQYDSYLAIVPGTFLSDIYKKYGPLLLESNVRSFLKFNGGVNRGIRGTILNEKSRFFTYNNGISTTASEIVTSTADDGTLLITAFTNLQIINGGQTTVTLAATSIKNNADLSGIYVQMKLTVLNVTDPELIRNIATYANSQNKVKTADLNSSHPFYVRMEEYSRKVYAPVSTGQIVQTLWFFERARGQYEQPLMQMTKRKRDDYKLVRPKSQKFTLTDLAKYINASDMLPHYVSWGGEVNAAHFHQNMLEQWKKDDHIFNELYYKELIGKKILFEYIGKVISDQIWYQEKRAYRPQLIAYTFAKMVYHAKKVKKCINYRLIWDLQKVPECLTVDIEKIARIIFDAIYDESRPTANIETYCKKEICWRTIIEIPYSLSEECYDVLISPSEKSVEVQSAKKEQKVQTEINDIVSIFKKGIKYWESLIECGEQQGVLSGYDVSVLNNAVKFCNQEYLELTPRQIKEIFKVMVKLAENGIQ